VSQDEARLPLVPPLRTTLGGKGQRPVVGTWDNKDLVYSFATLNLGTGQGTTRLLESPAAATQRTGFSKTARLHQAFAAHLRDLARAYPATLGKPVLITLDNAPGPQGTAMTEVLAAPPHLPLYRFPSYSPQLNLIERFWRVLGRRATHKRLFESRRELRGALRASFCYFHTMRHKVLSLIHSPRKKKEAELTAA
jgi:transposase